MYYTEPEDDLLLIYYTGVDDIDSEKIFEGDIVKRIPKDSGIKLGCTDTLYIVHWYNGGFILLEKSRYESGFFYGGEENISYYGKSLGKFKKMGNIFQNYEILYY